MHLKLITEVDLKLRSEVNLKLRIEVTLWLSDLYPRHCKFFFYFLFTDFPIFYIATCSKLVFFERFCVCE